MIIETIGLRKKYETVEALKGVSLAVPPGSIFGFLGRNGAGKTTTLKILLGMTRPTEGTARVFGLDVSDLEIRRRTAFVSEEKDLYDAMSVEEMIRFTASFYPRWRKDLEQQYVRQFGLPLDRKVRALSRGTRTQVALLLALCRSAELLILDEPTSGLDPAVSEEVLQALVKHAGEETTIFFSSHQIAEVEQIADHVAIIDRGRVAVSGALDDLRERYRRIQLVFDKEPPAATFSSPGVERLQRSGRVLTILSSAGSEEVVEEARKFRPASVDISRVTLKEIFLETVSPED